jgi:hypothetical protein
MGDLLTAASALAGAAIGAGASIGVSMRQRRSEIERERSHQDKLVKEEARISARILQSDLIEARNRLGRALHWRRYWAAHFALPTAGWDNYRASVARHMPVSGWADVSQYFLSASIVERQAIGARQDLNEARPSLTDYQRHQIELTLWRAKKALGALENFSGDSEQRRSEESRPEGPRTASR